MSPQTERNRFVWDDGDIELLDDSQDRLNAAAKAIGDIYGPDAIEAVKKLLATLPKQSLPKS